MMDHNEFVQHWNYFCSLAEMLEKTKEFVYHGTKESEEGTICLIHSDVYSDVFKQIILLAASEFEVVSKMICRIMGESPGNIIEISKIMLKQYPKIIETEVITLFWQGRPLSEWSVDDSEVKDKVKGIEWWKAYNAIKHNESDSYKKATLKNAVMSLSALYVIDLYLMFLQCGNLYILHDYPPVYFKCKYAPSDVFAAVGELPDFGNKSAVEKYQEMFDSVFNQ